MLKRVFSSKIFSLLLSAVLIYAAFRNVDARSIISELTMVPLWFVFFNIFYSLLINVMSSYRWSMLLLPRPTIRDVWNFTKSSYLGSFYTLIIPTIVAGDLLKWFRLEKIYPQMSKSKLISSVLLDRIVGMTTFVLVAIIALGMGKLFGFVFPEYLLCIFLAMFAGVIVFYAFIFIFDFEKFLCKFKHLNKLTDAVDLLKKESKIKLLKCFLVSVFCELVWIFQIWVIFKVFNTGIDLLPVYIFSPIIALVLILPISFAGFGPREYMYVHFFIQTGASREKILISSAFLGIIGILNSIIGGLALLF